MCPSTFASLMMGEMVGAPDAWSEGVVTILLRSNGCVLGITCNKPIRVSSPIPFKSLLRFRHGGFAIYTAELASAMSERFSREETELLMCENDYCVGG